MIYFLSAHFYLHLTALSFTPIVWVKQMQQQLKKKIKIQVFFNNM